MIRRAPPAEGVGASEDGGGGFEGSERDDQGGDQEGDPEPSISVAGAGPAIGRTRRHGRNERLLSSSSSSLEARGILGNILART